MKQFKMVVALGAALAFGATSVNATTIIFDNNNGGTAKAGTTETATAANSGNPDRWGPSLTFSDFTVSGGRSSGDNLNTGTFSKQDILMFNVDQDLSPNHGGLGVCSENATCSGSSDSFQSNVAGNYRNDEVLFFEFGSAVYLDTVWLNGDHLENVNGDTTINANDTRNALFNIFFSANGSDYTNLFSNQIQPTDLEYITTGLTDSYQHFAIAASGYGTHSSYVEAISYTQVPEPGTLALFGIALTSLIAVRRKKAA